MWYEVWLRIVEEDQPEFLFKQEDDPVDQKVFQRMYNFREEDPEEALKRFEEYKKGFLIGWNKRPEALNKG